MNQQTHKPPPCSILEESVFKYKLQELFIRKYGIMAAQAKRDCCERLEISRATFSADCNILASSRDAIPATRLTSYASFLEVNETDLINP